MPTNTQVQTFTNRQGRTFAVRMLPVGARYGREDCLTVDDDTLVDFYDTTHADDGAGWGDGFGKLGQFVSRYYAATLLGLDKYSNTKPGEGLCLDGGNADVWTIDGTTMDAVRAWIARRFTIVTIDGFAWHVDYNPVKQGGTVRPGTAPNLPVPFQTVGTTATLPSDAIPGVAVSALDRVLDKVGAWMLVNRL